MKNQVQMTAVDPPQIDFNAFSAIDSQYNPPVGIQSVYSRHFKRLLDILLVGLLIPLVLPLVLALAIVIWRDGSSPFYSQLRIGRSGRSFRLWKLRSMVPDADQQLSGYLQKNPGARAEWDLTQKLKHDPRITSFGHFLRKSSLDELPQLFNVLIGDMSIVGPRPMLLEQAQLYPGADYYHLRPGVTGLWQISDRNDSTFAARANYDATYAANLGFRKDFGILLQTVGVVLRGTGY